MKFKTTRKAIVEGSHDIICAGYCELQYLLRNHTPVAYTSGIYGWNFDVYEIGGKTICTGYKGMPGRRANNVGVYEKKAYDTLHDNTITHEEANARIENILAEFLAQA